MRPQKYQKFPHSHPSAPIDVKFCTVKRTQVPVGLNRCSESPLWGKKPDFWPVSKNNTGSLLLRGNPAGNDPPPTKWTTCFLCQAISVSPSTSMLVCTCLAIYRQVVCWPYCALQPCRTDVRQVLLVNSSCIRNTGRGYGSESRLDMFSQQQR